MCGAYMDSNGEKGGSGFYGKQTSKRVYGKWMNLNETRQGRVSQREREYCRYGENRDIFWGLYETEWDRSALVQTTVKCVV
jgi:hypothetical protein